MQLSIVVPIFNAEKSLKKCLESIQNQSIQDWECFLIDDGSIDKSRSICEAFAAYDNRFKVICKYNEGPAVARNIGIFLATGKWLSFVDADDWIESNRYEIAIKAAEEYNVSIVQSNINVYKNGQLDRIWHLGLESRVYYITEKLFLSEPVYDIGHCWDKIYKTELIKNSQIFFPTCDMCEDTFFNIHAVCEAGAIFSQAEATYNYNILSSTLSHTTLKAERKIKLLSTYKSMDRKFSSLDNYKYIRENVFNHFEGIFTRKDQIDYVFPYVDCSKADWQASYAACTGNKVDAQRFDGHEDLLKYKFRAIEKWMPWIGTIHLLVSEENQVPKWIDRSKVHVVLHKEFIPLEYLPTFNSCTIEMFLHNIPSLSEKFIYGNDDMYANDILKPKFFFPEENKLKANLQLRKLWHEGDINQVWAQIPINSLKLAAKDKPEFITKYVDGVHLYELQHIDKPMFKSVNREVFELYKKEICESITGTRAAKNLNQYLFIEYALFHDRGVFETFRYAYFQVGNDTNKILNALTAKENRPREICCNEAGNSTVEDFKKIEKAFAELYKNKSSYEL